MRQMRATCCSILLLATSTVAQGDLVTHFGDFADDFGGTGTIFDSTVPYDPGAFVPLVHAGVASIPKFDPSLGTLTDITVFVDPGEPIFYTLGGGMTITEVDPLVPTGFGAMFSSVAEVLLTYKEGPAVSPIFGDPISLVGGDLGAAGTGAVMTPIVPDAADGMLTGTASIFGMVDLSDFVGTGFVDELYVDLIIEDTADFTLVNSMATAFLDFDVFDSDSGVDDPVIGVTYTFTPVPEPGSAGLVLMLFSVLGLRRRPRTVA